eukprot:4776743-Alexandrium_andersonii.AAC.1
MSASLVGSEMCIRDSLRGAATAALDPPKSVSGARRRHFLVWPGGAVAPLAVSYTHLTLPTICSV